MLNHARVHPMIARHLEDVARGTLRMPIDRTYPLVRGRAGARVRREPPGLRPRAADPLRAYSTGTAPRSTALLHSATRPANSGGTPAALVR